MLEELVNNMVTNGLTVQSVAISTFITLGLGIIISLTYIFTNKNETSENLPITLLVLPVIISTVILLIGNNIAGAFSLAGIFSVIRFRSVAGNAKEIAYILLCVAAGLATGVYEYALGFLVTFILCVVMIISYVLKFGKKHSFNKELKLLVPEDENIEELLEPTLKKYTENYELEKMTTKDLGSIFEVTYFINLKDENKNKEFIDELRTLNGNLKICLNKNIRREGEL